MRNILFSLILGITIITSMWVFPVQAEEDFISDAQIVVQDLLNEESTEEPVEEIVIDDDHETISENATIDEAEPIEEIEDETENEDEIEEEAETEDEIEEEVETEDEIEDETGTGDEIEEEVETGDEIEEEVGTGDEIEEGTGTGDEIEEEAETGDATEGETSEESVAEEAIDGESEEIEEGQPEDPSAGVTGDLPGEPENPLEPQTPAIIPGAEENLENDDTTTPVRVYARPVINSISSDGTSITLEWDNAEGAVFQIYRWNLLPYMIGTSTTGSFVDNDVTYGRSYTYFIATSSSAYRYPYSQTVSIRVRRPIEDIDDWHRIGEDLAWNPAEGEEGGSSLVISGNGSMPDFSSPSETPWHDIAGEIKHISIDDGVTYVGDHTFSDMEELQEVSLPSSVREYGHDVFRGSNNLEFFNHDSAVDGDKLHIAVQYLMSVYSGDTFEPEVFVRKGADREGFDEMPELVKGRDYIVTYNSTTEVGDGTIEVTFIGDYADAGSVVIPFTVVSELRNDEKIKTVTSFELMPASSTYTGAAQHPDVIVKSGRWTLKEGVDYILTYSDMVDAGTYTVTIQGIGAYSGTAQAVYTILEQEQSEDPQPPVNPSDPGEGQNTDPDDINPQETEKETEKEQETEKEEADSKDEKTEKEETEDVTKPEKEETKDVTESEKEEDTEAVAESEKEEDTEAVTESEKEEDTEAVTESEKEDTEAVTESEKEEATETKKKQDKKQASLPSIFDGGSGGDLTGKGGFSLGNRLGGNNSNPVELFVGAVGIVGSICASVYFWFFYQFLHGMLKLN